MIRRPPRSPPFPYTTLSRSPRRSTHRGAEADPHPVAPPRRSSGRVRHRDRRARLDGTRARLRSEEHTSELQSRQYLVCRLLLEKKKQLTQDNHIIYAPTVTQ